MVPTGDLRDVGRQTADPVGVLRRIRYRGNSDHVQVAATGACRASSANAPSKTRLFSSSRRWRSTATCVARSQTPCRHQRGRGALHDVGHQFAHRPTRPSTGRAGHMDQSKPHYSRTPSKGTAQVPMPSTLKRAPKGNPSAMERNPEAPLLDALVDYHKADQGRLQPTGTPAGPRYPTSGCSTASCPANRSAMTC